MSRREVVFFSCEIMSTCFMQPRRRAVMKHRHTHLRNTKSQSDNVHAVRERKNTPLREPGELLRKETPRFSLFFKKKEPTFQHAPKLYRQKSPPPPIEPFVHLLQPNPKAMKRATKQQASPPPPQTRRKTGQDAPNATVYSMRTCSIIQHRATV